MATSLAKEIEPVFVGGAIRPATLDDIDQLLEVENHCFDTDRLSRRSFRRFLTKGRATCLVAERDGRLLGYALVLFRRGTSLARLYSLAVLPGERRAGLGGQLLTGAEDAAVQQDCAVMRTEVRPDNEEMTFFERRGYVNFGRLEDFFEDHEDALRYQKWLRVETTVPVSIRYYAQTTDFTCGPAAMMMGMSALDPAIVPNRQLELRLWREATTVYTSAGHGGCDPLGIAVSLANRNFAVQVHTNQDGPFFVDSVRDPDKREAMALIQADFREEACELGIPVLREPLGSEGLRTALDEGWVALVLVSLYRMVNSRTPHWILVYGHDGRRFFAHDPWVEDEDLETSFAAAALPIPAVELERMSRYGRARARATVLIGPRKIGA